ncbi:hypothetical protein GJ496_007803 [Pomphorhynchus laevis]|nr:hypothetical protein GJ496_007803 [Pomphorhynchus laevis]
MRAMLDQLMGSSADDKFRKKGYTFDHPRVCRLFLLGCCPHEILAATRVDLGECQLIHDNALKADFEAAQKIQDHYFDIEAVDTLSRFVEDCDRRTEFAKKKLKETQEELGEEAARKMNTINKLCEEIGITLASAEKHGAAGEVETSMKCMEHVDLLRKKKLDLECDFRTSMPASAYQQQKLRVCEVCSAYLGIHDNDRRLADHFGGKLHIGFIKIREKLEDLNTSVNERKVKRELDKGYQKMISDSQQRWKFRTGEGYDNHRINSASIRKRRDSRRIRIESEDEINSIELEAEERRKRSISRHRKSERSRRRSRSYNRSNSSSRSRHRHRYSSPSQNRSHGRHYNKSNSKRHYDDYSSDSSSAGYESSSRMHDNRKRSRKTSRKRYTSQESSDYSATDGYRHNTRSNSGDRR